MNKKKLLLIGGATLVVVVVMLLIFIFGGGSKTPPIEPTESSPIESSEVTIEEPQKMDDITSEDSSFQEIEDDGNTLKPNESIGVERPKNTGIKAEVNHSPAVEAEPSKETENNNAGGIQIGGNAPVEETYHCGYEKHHCQSAGYHASLLNRELDGCPYCGSHSCASFYALNEWGFTKYDPTLCAKYNVQEDPAEYCPDCGRKMWSLDNPTGCFRYLQDTQCECGDFVSGNTCHHH